MDLAGYVVEYPGRKPIHRLPREFSAQAVEALDGADFAQLAGKGRSRASHSVGRERVGHEQHEAARWTPLADLEAVGGRGNIGVHLVAGGGAWRAVPVEAVIVIHALSVPG